MPSPASRNSEVLARFRHQFATAALLVVVFGLSVNSFELIHRRSAFAEALHHPGGWPAVVLVVAVNAVVHELIRVLGWMLRTTVPRKSISVRPTFRMMGFMAVTSTALPLRAFRLGALLPAVILGGGSLFAGLASGQGLLVLWANFFLLESYADLTALQSTAGLPATAMVREYSDRLGCAVVDGQA